MQDKVCPIVLRQNRDSIDILLFRHPSAGVQLVKGTPDAGEDLIHASVRELWEESGLQISYRAMQYLGEKVFPAVGQKWHVYTCMVNEPRRQWSWQTIDDYGHIFRFFWCALEGIQDQFQHWEIDPRFIETILYIYDTLKSKGKIGEHQTIT